MAQLHHIGPSTDLEKQAFQFLQQQLPDDWTLFTNALVIERSGVVWEIDVVAIGPHGLYVIECKGWRGRIRATNTDWWTNTERWRSPLHNNRRSAQALRQALRVRNQEAGQRWIDHFVFLSHAEAIDNSGSEINRRHVFGRREIVGALLDRASFEQKSSRAPPPDAATKEALKELLLGATEAKRPPKTIRGWQIVDTEETTERYTEYRVVNALEQKMTRLLRVYPVADNDPETAIHVRWEARTLQSLSDIPGIQRADPPFDDDDGGIGVPFHDFPQSVTLNTWLECRSRSIPRGLAGLELRVGLWLRIARPIAEANARGIVHRLLTDEAVLVEDTDNPQRVCITGFDLARHVASNQTIARTSIHDERLLLAAPEVINRFSDATKQSDVWSLGVLLGSIFRGRRLFESTEDFRHTGAPSLLALHPGTPPALDAAYQQMVPARPSDRFASLKEAIEAVEAALGSRREAQSPTAASDPENLAPGTSLGDYDIRSKLGVGGLAVVYEAKHRIAGDFRALKVSRATDTATVALRDEYETLQRLNHHNLVKVREITGSLIPERLVLVMDRVQGQSLGAWLRDPQRRNWSPQELRNFAENLFAALEYLEENKVTHKDLKPDNLMLGPHGLVVIDFSLANRLPSETTIGTPAWRDPAMDQWDAECDRYAAAICLFQLYTHKHPFGEQPPEPGLVPRIDQGDFDNQSLRRFFLRALSPDRTARFPSARALRDFFLTCLGEHVAAEPKPPSPPAAGTAVVTLDTLLAALPGLSGTALAALRRVHIGTVGELTSNTEELLTNLPGLGKKKGEEVLQTRKALIERGLVPTSTKPAGRALFPQLRDDAQDLKVLNLKDSTYDALRASGLVQVGQVAMSTRADLQRIPSIGVTTVEQISKALIDYESQRGRETQLRTMADVWNQLTKRLEPSQIEILEKRYGLRGGAAQSQGDVAAAVSLDQPEVSRLERRALEVLDPGLLQELFDVVSSAVQRQGGIETEHGLCVDFDRRWERSEGYATRGLVHLVVAQFPARLHRQRFEEVEEPVVSDAQLDEKAISRFIQVAKATARAFPSETAESIRRTLRAGLPEFEFDHLALVLRLDSCLRVTDTELLYETPMESEVAVRYALDSPGTRLPITPDRLRKRVREIFSDAETLENDEHLVRVVGQLPKYVYRDGQIRLASERTSEPPVQSELPDFLRIAQKTPEQAAIEVLSALRGTNRCRFVVTPPEEHHQLGRALAKALDVPFVSFESAFLESIEGEFELFERASRSSVLRRNLTQRAKTVFDALIELHTGPQRTVVIGDTSLWLLCETLDLPRLLYDQTSYTNLGCVILALPGVHRGNQIEFDGTSKHVFSMPELVIPLDRLDSESRS